MKKQILFLIIILLNLNNSFSQITLQHVYTTDAPDRYVKLSLSGLKYVSVHYDMSSGTYTYFKLYNADHSLFKTINILQFPGKYVTQLSYISETLFDTDTLVEFIVGYYSISGSISAARVCNENGSILLERDTARAGGTVGWLDLGMGGQTIFPDGTSTKLIIGRSDYATTEIYNLPGQLACLECDNGLISGLIQQPNLISQEKNSLAFPNPFTDYVKIKYSLPIKYNRAFVSLYDITGNLIKKKEIDRNFSEIYITNDEIKQGVYFYQIVVDDKIISSDKIVKL